MKRKLSVLILISAVIIITLLSVGYCALRGIDIFGTNLNIKCGENALSEKAAPAELPVYIKHGVKYDSFIIGGTKIRAMSAKALGEYYETNFCPIEISSGAISGISSAAKYLISNHRVKNLIILLGYEEGENTSVSSSLPADFKKETLIDFYAKNLIITGGDYRGYLKSGFLSMNEIGFADVFAKFKNKARDCEHLGTRQQFLATHSGFDSGSQNRRLAAKDAVIDSIAEIKSLCSEKNTVFSLILAPEYYENTAAFSTDDMSEYKTRLAGITDYWDFSGYSPISGECRYFYDSRHFRSSVGDMMISKITQNGQVYVPENFGYYVTAENAAEISASVDSSDSLMMSENDYTEKLPVLMYHSFVAEGDKTIATQITPSVFEAQLKALSDAGYTSVTTEQLVAYCEKGEELPDKPVMITIDDGYLDNIQRACPILEKYNMHAVISIIGATVGGRGFYKNTQIPTLPYFTAEEAAPYIANGTIEIQSHSFDMHNVKGFDSDYRDGVLPKRGENQQAYIDAFIADCEKGFSLVKNDFSSNCLAFAYPKGFFTPLSEQLLAETGVKITFTTKAANNRIIKGLPQSLHGLNRYNIVNSVSGAALLARIK